MDNNKSKIVTTNMETIDGKLVDWRLVDQENYMMNLKLIKLNYQEVEESMKNVEVTQIDSCGVKTIIKCELWHEHCRFCWDDTTTKKENWYVSEDKKFWICQECFHDFKNHFHWTIEEPNKKI